MASVIGVLTLSYWPSVDTSSETWLSMFGLGGGKGSAACDGNNESTETEDAF